MKKDGSALISDSGKGVKIFFIIWLFFALLQSQSLHDYKVKDIVFKFNSNLEYKNITKYKSLINIKPGDPFNYNLIRESLANLYKTGSFSNIEARIEKLPGQKMSIYFHCQNKYIIKSISITQYPAKKKSKIKKSIFSMRENNHFDESQINTAIEEIRTFLKTRGYNNPKITYKIRKNERKKTIFLKFIVQNNAPTKIKNFTLNVTNKIFREEIKQYSSKNNIKLNELNQKLANIIKRKNQILYDHFVKYFNKQIYIPYDYQKKLEKIRKALKKQNYFFPELNLKEQYVNNQSSLINIRVDIDPGYKYIFVFKGITEKENLISSVWQRRVFEKWAENESKARILDFLRNKGYMNVKVESSIRIKNATKFITFTIEKNEKYTLGKINFTGNKAISEEKLNEIVKTEDRVYDKLIELRYDFLYINLEILRLYYYYSGFPFSKIIIQPHFRKNKADINFIINEGDKYTVESILFSGNKSISVDKLLSVIKTKNNSPFVQQILNVDMERLNNFYYSRGFDEVKIDLEISSGKKKSVLIKINEGISFRMWNFFVMGASTSQARLIKKLFPLKKNSYYDRRKIENFISEIENSSIFSEIKVIKVKKEPDIMDILIKVTPDRSKYYGFGIGWEDRKKIRGTLEYQEKNIFNSYSTLSALLQIGFSERRGVLSFDTPYFFNSDLNSSFKIWDEDEIYPSYKFNRYGIGESIIKKITVTSYVVASLKWYRTKLTELLITEKGIDTLNDPFDTTTFSLSYIVERRDDPFNPIKGHFFSSNLKIGLPLFEKNYSFFKFFWSYQKNFKLFNRGSFSFSVRNGFSAGDMSITERFFAGGIHTFRGTRNDRLGPIDVDTNEPRGGNALILLNLEATLPLGPIPIEDLYYSIFADVGNVFEKSKDFDIGNVEKAIGFGLKYKTPIGPLRIDLAWNLRKDAESDFLVQIGIGNVF